MPGYDNWSVLTAGAGRPIQPVCSAPTECARWRTNEQSQQFDLVLFDTPPVLGLADAALVAEHCDGLIMVVSLDRVDRSLPKNPSPASAAVVSFAGHRDQCPKEEKQSTAYGYGKYGYGGYGGYGYAAYDTSAAYGYYANDEDDTQPSEDDDSTTAVNPRKRRRRPQQWQWCRRQSPKPARSLAAEANG